MNTKICSTVAALGIGALCAAANAGITFSNVTISTPYDDNVSYVTSDQDIDFLFDSTMNVLEGDPEEISLVISYDAWSMQAMTQDTMVLSVLGGLLGAGEIQFSERIWEITEAAGDNLLVDYFVTLGAGDELPHVADLMFERPAMHFHVEKRITLRAPDETQGIDLASISLVEQRFVPTPGAAALMGLAGLTGLRRRR
ncbi:MAG: hypothetical protein R3B46_06455 [Phycisphaerales bacterium]|nr:hypothetical protein [Phycisphaerales bacterium]